jgi:hypothetical protein
MLARPWLLLNAEGGSIVKLVLELESDLISLLILRSCGIHLSFIRSSGLYLPQEGYQLVYSSLRRPSSWIAQKHFRILYQRSYRMAQGVSRSRNNFGTKYRRS